MNTPQTFDFQSGPDLSGYWKNYKTGQIVRIKDTIFEDNNLVGVTYDGQMVNMNKLKDFVKYNPTADEASQSSNSAQTKSTDQSVLLRGMNTDTPRIPDGVDSNSITDITDEYAPYDYVHNREPRFQLKLDDSGSYSSCKSTSDPDRAAIIKVLDNLDEKDKPKITVKLDWVIPDGVKFLQDYLHITPAQIAEVIKERYADLTILNDAVTDEILHVLGVKTEVKNETKTEVKTEVKTEAKTEENPKQPKQTKKTKK